MIGQVNIFTEITLSIDHWICSGREESSPGRFQLDRLRSRHRTHRLRQGFTAELRVVQHHFAGTDTARIGILIIQPNFQAVLLGLVHRSSDAVKVILRQIRKFHSLPRMHQKAADALIGHLLNLPSDLILLHLPVPKPERLDAF